MIPVGDRIYDRHLRELAEHDGGKAPSAVVSRSTPSLTTMSCQLALSRGTEAQSRP